METNAEDTYYYRGMNSGNRHEGNYKNDLRDGDFGREYENRYRNRDGRNRKSYDEYLHPGNSYSESSYGSYWGDARNKENLGEYGARSSGGSGYGYDSDRNGNDRTPGQREQGGYGTGRMGGYSGSAFGGSNYSSKGSFSGNSEYGSMSGGGGNMSRGASSSGYGNNYENQTGRKSWDADPYRKSSGNYDSSGPTPYPRENTYKGYGSNNNRRDSGNFRRESDRGGYTDYDPNNRWNS